MIVDSIPCRVIIDPAPSTGAWNMAVDEALLNAAIEEEGSSVRLYQWSEPTVSLGYFQSPAATRDHPLLRELPVIRRLSGGGAILHHHELTYSVTLSASHPLARIPSDLYTNVHKRILNVLAEFGVTGDLRGVADESRGGQFLCFGRGDAFDVVMGQHKVLGSAQRRRKGAILQHGSLILRHSEFTPEFPGICDCAEVSLDPALLSEKIAEAVGALLSSQFRRVELPEAVRAAADGLLPQYCVSQLS